MRQLTIKEITERLWVAVYASRNDHAQFWLQTLHTREQELTT